MAVDAYTLNKARNGMLAVSHRRAPSTSYSYLVDGTLTDRTDIESAARLAMIADGRAPGTVVHLDRDPDGSGRWEVVITHRPLRQGESFGSNGRRVSTGGTKSEGWYE